MKAALLLLVWLFLSCGGWAQDTDKLQQAQKAFALGQYGRSADLYQELLAQGAESAQLHYNLALAHQSLNHKGQARAHYERARQLNPWDRDTAHNLARLRTSLDDNETDPPAVRQIAILLSSSALFWVLTAAHIGFWWSAWKYRQGQRELHLWSTLTCLGLAVACCGLLWVRYRLPDQAAVIPASVVLKNGPGREFTDSLSLHAGTLVDVVRREGDWTEVEAMGTVRAWIPESDLARVN